jgi:benzodiazapine receptor
MPFLPLLSFTYIPLLTLPSFFFSTPYVATLFPVIVGGVLGANTPSITRKIRGVFFIQTNLFADPSKTSAIDPPFRPPDLVFPLVWTPLYALMGYSSHLAWKTSAAPGSFTLYTITLALNFAFLPIYSAMGERLLGLIDMLVLDGLVIYLICAWGGGRDTLGREAWGLVPYITWLGFATYLAVAYGWLNGWKGHGRWKMENGVKQKAS